MQMADDAPLPRVLWDIVEAYEETRLSTVRRSGVFLFCGGYLPPLVLDCLFLAVVGNRRRGVAVFVVCPSHGERLPLSVRGGRICFQHID
jgi:hypothetical protein